MTLVNSEIVRLINLLRPLKERGFTLGEYDNGFIKMLIETMTQRSLNANILAVDVSNSNLRRSVIRTM